MYEKVMTGRDLEPTEEEIEVAAEILSRLRRALSYYSR